MKKAINLILILAISFFFLFGCEEDYTIPEDVNTVNIFTMNDTHGAFVSDEYPGMEKVSMTIKGMESEYGRFVKIANGDIFQGSYVSNVNFGMPLVDAMNYLDFDAFVIGNHEFDWGIEKIAQYKDGDPSNGEAEFSFLAANIVYKETGEKLPWTDDYVIVENNGYKVGIIGVIGHKLESSIASEMVADYDFLHPREIVQELAYELRIENECDVVVVATHSYDNLEINDYLGLPDESRIDAIITGHNHLKIATKQFRNDGFSVPIIQCNDKNQNVGAVVIEMDEENNPVNAIIRHYNPADYPVDRKMKNLINKFSADINEGNRVIGYTTENLSEGRIGRETVKAMYEKYDVTVAIINTGGVRGTLKTGNIRIKDIFEVFPFDNRIVLTSISGYQLSRLISAQGSYLYAYPYFDMLNIESGKTYNIVTIDYVFTSSYYRSYFKESPREDKELMRDIFIEYIEDFYKK